MQLHRSFSLPWLRPGGVDEECELLNVSSCLRQTLEVQPFRYFRPTLLSVDFVGIMYISTGVVQKQGDCRAEVKEPV